MSTKCGGGETFSPSQFPTCRPSLESRAPQGQYPYELTAARYASDASSERRSRFGLRVSISTCTTGRMFVRISRPWHPLGSP